MPVSTTVRIIQRIGLDRVSRDVAQSLGEYLKQVSAK